MISGPLITVVIPIFNVDNYLLSALNSIMHQTYKKLDIILVDDGSSDDSGRIADTVAASDCRIRVIHQQNAGLSEARNVGISLARGSLITFLDSDDFVNYKYIEHLLSCMMNSKADIAVTQVIEFNDGMKYDSDLLSQDSQNQQPTRNTFLTSKLAIEDMLYQRHILPSAFAKMYRVQLFADIGYPKGKLYEDIGTTTKLFDKAQRIVYSEHKDYYYRIRKGSIQQSGFSHNDMDLMDALDEISQLVSQKYPSIIPSLRSKQLAASFNILMKMSDRDYYQYSSDQKLLWANVERNRIKVCLDFKAAPRERLAALLSFLGFGLTKKCYLVYKKHKYE